MIQIKKTDNEGKDIVAQISEKDANCLKTLYNIDCTSIMEEALIKEINKTKV